MRAPDAGDPLAVGSRAPAFALEGTMGPVSLKEALTRGPVALFFYPGNNTPG